MMAGWAKVRCEAKVAPAPHWPGNLHEDVPVGDATARLAAVNLDWDHVRAHDLNLLLQSFVPESGSILSS